MAVNVSGMLKEVILNNTLGYQANGLTDY